MSQLDVLIIGGLLYLLLRAVMHIAKQLDQIEALLRTIATHGRSSHDDF